MDSKTHSPIDPCDCRLSRDAALACPREARGSLIWSTSSTIGDQPVGPMVIVDRDGRRETLTFGAEWEHVSEGLARDHAAIRHLQFVVAQ